MYASRALSEDEAGPPVKISMKDCIEVDAGWRRFWAKRGGVPSLDMMEISLSREIKELTDHVARLKRLKGGQGK